MGAWAVERTGLENQQGFLPFVGSNPTPSAICINMDKRIINKQVIIENYSEKNSVIYDNLAGTTISNNFADFKGGGISLEYGNLRVVNSIKGFYHKILTVLKVYV